MKKRILLATTILISGLVSAQNPASFSSTSNWQNLCTNGDSILFTADYDSAGVFTGKGITGFGNGTASYSAVKAGAGKDTVIYMVIDTASFNKVSLGGGFSCFIKSDGEISSTGRNNFGQLGNGTTTNNNTPMLIGVDSNWILTTSGSFHNLAIRKNGTLWAWGLNGSGQLGDSTLTNRSSPLQIGQDSTWKIVGTGAKNSIGLRKNGSLWAWGNNDYNQLGDGTTTLRNSPTQIGQDSTWSYIYVGDYHTLALKIDGTLWAWGDNTFGAIGDGTTTNRSSPVQIGTDTNWTSIASGYSHNLAVKDNGTLWAWGYNTGGQLGDGTTTHRNSPKQIGTDTNWMNTAAGYRHSLAIKDDGTLWAWGSNFFGQLGDGTSIDRSTPVQIGQDSTWQSIALGENHSSAIKLDGSLWIWGLNSNGQLGDGTTTNRNTPTQLIIPDTNSTRKIISIAAPTVSSTSQASCGSYLWPLTNTNYSVSGTYKDTILNAAGCDSVISLVLTIDQVDTSVTQAVDSLYANDSLAAYQWIDCGNGDTAIAGATNRGFKPQKSGTYAVVLTNGVCNDTSACNQVIRTGIRENTKNVASFSIYPNPAKNKLVVKLDKTEAGKVLRIYDLTGKQVLSHKIMSFQENIDVSSLAKGIYMLKYENGVKKLIITN